MANYSWKTRDGYKIKVKDLTDRHLANTICYLRCTCEHLNNKESLQLGYAASIMQGEMAQAALDRESFRAEFIQPGERWPIYNDMMREFMKRDLYSRYPNVVSQPRESF
jgi:hypothetical protein